MARRRKRSVGGIILGLFGGLVRAILLLIVSVILIGMICSVFCGMAFAYYVRDYIMPNADVPIENVGLKMSSIIYVQDPTTGEYYEYETLHSDENRIWVDFDDIPQNMKDAIVAIEDKFFYAHKGVYWKRTFGAALAWVTGDDDSYGGSTITQQLIKNTVNDKEFSVKRKLNEIFRALALEQKINDKNRILELYLNTVYFGNSAYGVGTAATTYFNKDIGQLSLSECALIAGITNNPYKFNPLLHPEAAKKRQRIILQEMHDQGFITDAEYRNALSEELIYVTREEKDPNAVYSWFTETVIADVKRDLQEQRGLSADLASVMLNSGGLRIYTTMDPNIQSVLEELFLDDANFPNISKNGKKPQSAMVVMDVDGNIKGIVGARGEKEGNLLRNHATVSRRSPGSSIKPLASYAPGLDLGLITPDSVITDMPIIELNGSPYPRNYSRTYSGQRTVRYSVAQSLNTVAMNVLEQVGYETSYDYMTNRFGIQLVDRLVKDDGTVLSDLSPGALGMGGLTKGVTVREMCAAYTSFMDGNFAGSRCYTRVEDDNGDLVLDNPVERVSAFNRPSTPYYMRTLLQGVTSPGGTASFVDVPGMSVAAKTGTTQNDFDRYFVGFTPYYVGACWFGYATQSTLEGLTSSPPAHMWEMVMQRIHEGLPSASFDEYDGYVTVSYCLDSGLRSTPDCSKDISGSRVATGRYFPGDEPTAYCNLHKTRTVCKESGKVSTEFCPETREVSMLDLTRLFPMSISVGDQYRCFTGDNPPVGAGMVVGGGDAHANDPCPLHTEAADPEGADILVPEAGGETPAESTDGSTGGSTGGALSGLLDSLMGRGSDSEDE